MEQELEIVRAIARQAGQILLKHYKGDAEVQWKGHDDPVTVADHEASEYIVAELRRHFPDDGILSEEAPDDRERLERARVWMVDPMDGTKQFIEHLGEFAVMIGLAVRGVAQLGVVYKPVDDRMFYAATGLGAYVEEGWSTKRLRVSPDSDATHMVAAMSRSHHSPLVDLVNARLGITQHLRSGSVGLKIGLLAEARAHLYLHLGAKTNQWDTCAPEAILREAGGSMTDIHGEPMKYNTTHVRNTTGIVASNGPLHARVLTTIAKVLEETDRS
ncbi:MAG: 3'(2'),5'-bisphosphate nucleotidase CysQ [Blastocatellia bacterium]